jgi:signal transduction histidine kinase
MIFRSLRANLNLGLFVSLVVLAIVLWSLSGIAFKSIIRDYITTRLEHDAETLLVATTAGRDGRLVVDEQKIQGIYQRPFSGHYFVIQTAKHTWYSRSLWDETLSLPGELEPGSVSVTHQIGPQQQKLLVRSQYYEKQGNRLLIMIAEDVSHIDQQIKHLQRYIGILILIIVVVLMLLQTLIIQLGMRPVRQARQAIKKLESGEATELPETVPSEVLPLVREVNRLLHHQQQRLLRSRHAMGDVAHAIKTPLALILQWYETLSETEQQQHETVLRQVQQIQQRIDSELKRARMAGDQQTMARFNLDSDLPALLDTLKRLHHERDIQVDTRINTDPQLLLEREDGMELFGNLFDNAWKWARGKILFSVTELNGMLHISLEDDGPGIEEQQMESLLQRGKRQDESVTGHGIGLSIVREVVNSYHGKLLMDRSQQLGGLRVIIQLPLAIDPD